MYVISDQRRNRVVGFPALDADALGQSLQPPTTIGNLSLPSGLCLDASRRLHIADAANDRIVTFAFDTATWTTFGAGLVTNPRHVAVDANGRIYAVDGARILRVDKEDGTGAVVMPGLVEHQRPIAIAVDAAGRVFIVDATTRGLWFTANDGGSWDPLPLPAGDQPNRPVSISSRRDGGVLVSDLANHRVIAVDAGGGATTLITEDDGLFLPICAQEDGPGVTVLDAGPEWLRRFLPVGTRYVAADFIRGARPDGTSRFGRPSGLAIGAAS
jgi:sugar lactone lactonase YvrE